MFSTAKNFISYLAYGSQKLDQPQSDSDKKSSQQQGRSTLPPLPKSPSRLNIYDAFPVDYNAWESAQSPNKAKSSFSKPQALVTASSSKRQQSNPSTSTWDDGLQVPFSEDLTATLHGDQIRRSGPNSKAKGKQPKQYDNDQSSRSGQESSRQDEYSDRSYHRARDGDARSASSDDQSQPLASSSRSSRATQKQRKQFDSSDDQSQPLASSSRSSRATQKQRKQFDSSDDQSQPLASSSRSSRAAQKQRKQFDSSDDQSQPLASSSRSSRATQKQRKQFDSSDDQSQPLASSSRSSRAAQKQRKQFDSSDDQSAQATFSDPDRLIKKVLFADSPSSTGTSKKKSIIKQGSNSSATNSYTGSTSTDDQASQPMSSAPNNYAMTFLRNMGVSVDAEQNEQLLNHGSSSSNEVTQLHTAPVQTTQNAVIKKLFSTKEIRELMEEKVKEERGELENRISDLVKSVLAQLNKKANELYEKTINLPNIQHLNAIQNYDSISFGIAVQVKKIDVMKGLSYQIESLDTIEEYINTSGIGAVDNEDFIDKLKDVFGEDEAAKIIKNFTDINTEKKQVARRPAQVGETASYRSLITASGENAVNQIEPSAQREETASLRSIAGSERSLVTRSSNFREEPAFNRSTVSRSDSRGTFDRIFKRNKSNQQLNQSLTS